MSTTVRIPPRSGVYKGTMVYSPTNPSNALTNVDSGTCASYPSRISGTTTDAYGIILKNFDFSLVPEGATIDSLLIRVKVARSVASASAGKMVVAYDYSSDSIITSPSALTTFNPQTMSTTAGIIQFGVGSTTAQTTWNAIKSYGVDFGVAINAGRTTRSGVSIMVYGAEINVTYSLNTINKVAYGDTTLIDLTGDTVTAESMLSGRRAHSKTGNIITGTIITKSSTNVTFSNTTVTVEPGYYASKVVKNATDANLIAGNIKKDVAIFGVTGTYEGTPITNQNKTVTPTESEQSVTADSGYTGLGTVTVEAIDSEYIGSDITQRDSTDLSAIGATVTVPAGYYDAQATKTVNSGNVTGFSSISAVSATVSTGTNTLTLTKTGIDTTPTVSAGYISHATASTATVSLTASVTTKAAATITPGTSNQTIASGTYLTGTQTITGDADLAAGNIKAGTQIFNVTGTYTADANATAGDIVSTKTAYVNGAKVTGSLVINKYYTGSTTPSSSLGNDGDIYLKI